MNSSAWVQSGLILPLLKLEWTTINMHMKTDLVLKFVNCFLSFRNCQNNVCHDIDVFWIRKL